MPLFGWNCHIFGENVPFSAKISNIPPFWAKIPRFVRKYPILGENAPLWRKFQKYPISGENFENTPILGKNAPFWRKSWKYPIFGENVPFWAKIPKIPHFGRKFWKYPILGENPRNTTFWAKNVISRNAIIWIDHGDRIIPIGTKRRTEPGALAKNPKCWDCL